MNREIKFRAWDKERKVMRNNAMPRLSGMGASWGINGEFDSIGEYEFMQYTGLKDKNSNDIYEGDVCEDARGFRFVVVWDDDARFLGRGIGAQQEYIRYVGQEPAVKIIGNIYENPKLINTA